MKAVSDRQDEVVRLVAAYKVAHRAACDHLRDCAVCDGAWLCPEGKRVWMLADGLEARLPWRALRDMQAARAAESPEPLEPIEDCRASRWGLLAAFGLGVVLMCAWPLYLAWR
jgi:hypothetical protein